MVVQDFGESTNNLIGKKKNLTGHHILLCGNTHCI